jgi:hypothetical protein
VTALVLASSGKIFEAYNRLQKIVKAVNATNRADHTVSVDESR